MLITSTKSRSVRLRGASHQRAFWSALSTYNQFHNNLRLFDVLPNFNFTTSERMGNYYLYIWYIGVASPVAEQLKTGDLRKIENIRKLSKAHRMAAQCPVPLSK